MSEEYVWRTLAVGKVNHALNDSGDVAPNALAICGREGQFSVGNWLPFDRNKRNCLNCLNLIKVRKSNDPARRNMIFERRKQ